MRGVRCVYCLRSGCCMRGDMCVPPSRLRHEGPPDVYD